MATVAYKNIDKGVTSLKCERVVDDGGDFVRAEGVTAYTNNAGSDGSTCGHPNSLSPQTKYIHKKHIVRVQN